MANEHFPNVLLCDYATQDINNKFVLAGVYSSHIVVPEFPANMMLAIYINYVADSSGPTNIMFYFAMDGVDVGYSGVDILVNETDPINAIILPGLAMGTDKETTITIDASINGQPRETILTKRIISKSAIVPSVLPQPS